MQGRIFFVLIMLRPSPKWGDAQAPWSYGQAMADHTDTALPHATRIARARFRAWHRGTREADYTVGCFFDRFHAEWDEAAFVWFEALLDEEDVDILGWALKTIPVPENYQGPMMQTLQKLDFVTI